LKEESLKSTKLNLGKSKSFLNFIFIFIIFIEFYHRNSYISCKISRFMTYKLSPSSLSLFKDCPRCFWLHQNNEHKRPTGIFPSLPSGMDKILKEHFDSFMEKGKLPPELKNDSICKNMKLFENKDILEEWRNNFRGIRYEDSDGNLLRGAVDNILVNGDKLVVLDYKTRGYPLKEDTPNYYQNQLNIYTFLLRENGYKTENYGLLLFYHPNKVLETGEVLFNTDMVKMKVDPSEGKKLFTDALKFLKDDCPKKHEQDDCNWCKLVE